MAEASRIVDERVGIIQSAYATKYNLRTGKKEFKVGERVLILDSGQANKMKPRWVGPAEIKEKKRPDSYIVQLPGERGRWLHANKLRPYLARVNNVGVIFQTYEEFGEVPTMPYGPASEESKGSENVSLTELQNQQRAELEQLLGQFGRVFSSEPGRCVSGVHKISLVPGAKPSQSFPCKVPISLRKEVDKQIEQLLE